jgi:hypothetical protein
MCHDWWQWRMYQESEASRNLWDEFERTRPVSDPDPAEEDAEVRLGAPDTAPAGSER